MRTAIGPRGFESLERFGSRELSPPPEKSSGVFIAKSLTVVILGLYACSGDLLPSAANGEVEGAHATADARHKAEYDGYYIDP